MARPGQEKGALLRAAEENRAQDVRSWLERGGRLPDVRNKEKRNLLHLAAAEGSEEVLATLLQHPKVLKHVDARDAGRRTPLHLAAAMGYEQCARRLMEAKAAMEKHDTEGCTPLLLAVKFEWPETVRFLLNAGANPLEKDKYGHSSVEVAQQKKDPELIPLVLDFAQRRQPSARFGMLLQQFEKAAGGDPNAEDSTSPRQGPRDEGVSPTLVGATAGEASDLEIQWQDSTPTPVVAGCPDARAGDDILGVVHGQGGQSAAVGATSKTASAPPARFAPRPRQHAQLPAGPREFATFRRHVLFPESVARLECEVEWKDPPRVGALKPGGEGERHGLRVSDRVVEIAGSHTKGKGRDDLLPLLKIRPLMIKLDREEQVRDLGEPHVQIQLLVERQFEELGVQLGKLGELPTIVKVQPQSDAWAAGLLEGDAVLRVHGQFTGGLSRATMTSLLEQRGEVTIWRRPLGMDLNTPWKPVASGTE